MGALRLLGQLPCEAFGARQMAAGLGRLADCHASGVGVHVAIRPASFLVAVPAPRSSF